MPEIELKGLQGGHPLGALAAFGLLRCCGEVEGLAGSRLGWREDGTWSAELRTETADGEELIRALVERQGVRGEALELVWADKVKDIKVAPEAVREAMNEAVTQANSGGRCWADFMAAFTSEMCEASEGKVEPTAFCMTSGQQKFLKEVALLNRKLAGGLRRGGRRKTCEELFREALLGPWRYEDPQHSLGWDPSTERLHALRAQQPSKEDSAGVTAAVWLAFEALPLFPCFLSEGRLRTTGFGSDGDGRGRAAYLTWPLWTEPLTLGSLRSLLSLPELTEPTPPLRQLQAMGVEAVFRAERYRVKSQGAYYLLRPPACL